MLDLYQRLDLPQDAPEEAIRATARKTSADVRAAVEQILLDPRRRAVYDRNRRLLMIISELRSDLGLNYTPFWSRPQFKDFWQMPVFEMPRSSAPAGRRVDKMMIAGAFHAVRRVHHHSRHHAARWGNWWIAALMLITGVLVAASLWLADR